MMSVKTGVGTTATNVGLKLLGLLLAILLCSIDGLTPSKFLWLRARPKYAPPMAGTRATTGAKSYCKENRSVRLTAHQEDHNIICFVDATKTETAKKPRKFSILPPKQEGRQTTSSTNNAVVGLHQLPAFTLTKWGNPELVLSFARESLWHANIALSISEDVDRALSTIIQLEQEEEQDGVDEEVGTTMLIADSDQLTEDEESDWEDMDFDFLNELVQSSGQASLPVLKFGSITATSASDGASYEQLSKAWDPQYPATNHNHFQEGGGGASTSCKLRDALLHSVASILPPGPVRNLAETTLEGWNLWQDKYRNEYYHAASQEEAWATLLEDLMYSY